MNCWTMQWTNRNCDPRINILLPLERSKFFGLAQNVDPHEAVTSLWRLFTFYNLDVEQYVNKTIKYVPVTGNNGTWIQTDDGDYIYLIFINSVIIIDKMTLLSPLVAILFWMECSSWSNAFHWHLEQSSGTTTLIHESIRSCNVLLIMRECQHV